MTYIFVSIKKNNDLQFAFFDDSILHPSKMLKIRNENNY
jgi:hypothetical protein